MVLPAIITSLPTSFAASASPPSDFDINNRDLLFSRQKPGHLGTANAQVVIDGTSKSDGYSAFKNQLFLTADMNVCSLNGENFAPGQPVALIGRQQKVDLARQSVSNLTTLKQTTGTNIFVRIDPTKIWTYMGWYCVDREGAEPLPVGPGCLGKMHPELRRIFCTHVKYQASRPSPLVGSANDKARKAHTRALNAYENDQKRMQELLDSWGFNSRTPDEALRELDDPMRVGRPIVMRYLVFRCTSFRDDCFAEWARSRTAEPLFRRV